MNYDRSFKNKKEVVVFTRNPDGRISNNHVNEKI